MNKMNQTSNLEQPTTQNNLEQEKKIKDYIHVNPWKCYLCDYLYYI